MSFKFSTVLNFMYLTLKRINNTKKITKRYKKSKLSFVRTNAVHQQLNLIEFLNFPSNLGALKFLTLGDNFKIIFDFHHQSNLSASIKIIKMN